MLLNVKHQWPLKATAQDIFWVLSLKGFKTDYKWTYKITHIQFSFQFKFLEGISNTWFGEPDNHSSTEIIHNLLLTNCPYQNLLPFHEKHLIAIRQRHIQNSIIHRAIPKCCESEQNTRAAASSYTVVSYCAQATSYLWITMFCFTATNLQLHYFAHI